MCLGLADGLPDPLGEFTALPQTHIARLKGRTGREGTGEEDEVETKEKEKGTGRGSLNRHWEITCIPVTSAALSDKLKPKLNKANTTDTNKYNNVFIILSWISCHFLGSGQSLIQKSHTDTSFLSFRFPLVLVSYFPNILLRLPQSG